MPSVMKACHPRICPLKSFARIMLARMSFHSCADGATAFGITLILAIASKQRSLAGARADMVRTASRILEGLVLCPHGHLYFYHLCDCGFGVLRLERNISLTSSRLSATARCLSLHLRITTT